MDNLTKRLRAVLQQAFPRALIVLDLPSKDRLLGGFIVWSGFSRLDPLGRQQRIHKALDSGLSKAQRQRISLLFAMSPLEWRLREEARLEEEETILRTAATIRRERAQRKRLMAGSK